MLKNEISSSFPSTTETTTSSPSATSFTVTFANFLFTSDTSLMFASYAFVIETTVFGVVAVRFPMKSVTVTFVSATISPVIASTTENVFTLSAFKEV